MLDVVEKVVAAVIQERLATEAFIELKKVYDAVVASFRYASAIGDIDQVVS